MRACPATERSGCPICKHLRGKGSFSEGLATGDGVIAYRFIALRHALRAECRGLRLTRGHSVQSIVKREFGFQGSASSLGSATRGHDESARSGDGRAMSDCCEWCDEPCDTEEALCPACANANDGTIPFSWNSVNWVVGPAGTLRAHVTIGDVTFEAIAACVSGRAPVTRRGPANTTKIYGEDHVLMLIARSPYID